MKCYLPENDELLLQSSEERKIPFFISAVPAGFPSPADDYIERKLDLHKHLIKHPAATFFVKASGHSMVNAGIMDGDLLVVDRALEPADGKIVIAVLDGDLTVKRLMKREGKLFLVPENDEFAPIEVKEEMDFQIWGVVAHVIHSV